MSLFAIIHPSISCKCELCAPHIIADSPEASDDRGDSSDSDGSVQDTSDFTIMRPVASQYKEHASGQGSAGQPGNDAEAAAVLLRSQKREAIRKAVEAQRAELDGSRK